MKPTIRFKTKLPQFKTNAPVFINLPKSVNAKLPSSNSRDTIMIEGAINSFPFRAALELDNAGSHTLKINKIMYDGITKGLDTDIENTVIVEITRIGDEPENRIPADLQKALRAIPLARESWTDITPMARRDWIFSITTAKLPETRKRRIDKACDMLASGKRRLCCFPGVKNMMQKNAKSCGMWLPMTSAKK